MRVCAGERCPADVPHTVKWVGEVSVEVDEDASFLKAINTEVCTAEMPVDTRVRQKNHSFIENTNGCLLARKAEGVMCRYVAPYESPSPAQQILAVLWSTIGVVDAVDAHHLSASHRGFPHAFVVRFTTSVSRGATVATCKLPTCIWCCVCDGRAQSRRNSGKVPTRIWFSACDGREEVLTDNCVFVGVGFFCILWVISLVWRNIINNSCGSRGYFVSNFSARKFELGSVLEGVILNLLLDCEICDNVILI